MSMSAYHTVVLYVYVNVLVQMQLERYVITLASMRSDIPVDCSVEIASVLSSAPSLPLPPHTPPNSLQQPRARAKMSPPLSKHVARGRLRQHFGPIYEVVFSYNEF